ncbi:S8 family serine peptidase [Acidobacteriota bacterium]
MNLKRLMWLLIFCVLMVGWISIEGNNEEEFLIQTGSKRIKPVAGERILPLGIERHLLVQFYEIPGQKNRQSLAKQGISLMRYLDGNAYIVSVTADGDKALSSVPGVRAVLGFDRDMKLSPLLKAALGQTPEGAEIPVVIAFHDDIPFKQALKDISNAGLMCQQPDYHYHNIVKLKVSAPVLQHLLSTDTVRWIDVALTPPKLDNAWAASRNLVDQVWNKAPYKKPRGKDERVGIWDGGKIQKHNDLRGRVRLIETTLDFSEHATHVSGTIASSGAGNKNARGMTTRSQIYSYNFNGDIMGEMRDAVAEHQIKIANHSWSNIVGWNYSEENETWEWWGNRFFGYYHIEAASQDRLVRDTDLLIVRAAGNDRDEAYLGPYEDGFSGATREDLQPPDPEYRSITPYASSKNVVTVGALMKDDVMTGFSNWGPTDDGRIKPDVVATGNKILSTVGSEAYSYFTGTSMSTPVVTGSAALLRGTYKTLVGGEMGSTLLKCLLVHSARDLGKTGPDYSYGFGLVDVKYAADVIKAKGGAEAAELAHSQSILGSRMIEGQINNGIQRRYQFTVPSGAKELRATLVWHDPEGNHLINNLNLWLVSPTGKRVDPFALDPNRPAQPAKRKINTIDNIEHALTKNPILGKWKVFIRGAKVPEGPQKFALILSAGEGNGELEQKNEGVMSVKKVYAHGTSEPNLNVRKQYRHGTSIYFKTALSLPENADWGKFYGTVSMSWKVSHQGKTIFKTNTASSSLHAIPADKSWVFSIGPYIIPSGMARGEYVLKVVVTLHNGISKTKSFNFKVI